jgi:hypothetical protein
MGATHHWGQIVPRLGRWTGLLGRISVTHEQLTLTRWPGPSIAIDRESTDSVRFQRVSRSFGWHSNVSFETRGPGRDFVFVPFRAVALREALVRHGWMISDLSPLTMRGLFRRP